MVYSRSLFTRYWFFSLQNIKKKSKVLLLFPRLESPRVHSTHARIRLQYMHGALKIDSKDENKNHFDRKK